MSSSSSSDFNASSPQHSFIAVDLYCFILKPTSFIFMTFYIINLFPMLPLCLLIFYYGLKKSSFSHLDCFTYHVVSIELVGVFRCIAYWYGAYVDDIKVLFIGGMFSVLIWTGETLFHVLTCVERYLAIVHPIMYRSLKNQRGTKIRNVSIICAWLLSLAAVALFNIQEYFVILDFCLMILSLSITAFCSISALCVLVRPFPSKQNAANARVDQSKRRALNSMILILGTQGVRFGGAMTWGILFMSEETNECVIMAAVVWANLPNSLVLPLLYLQRAGKFKCCK